MRNVEKEDALTRLCAFVASLVFFLPAISIGAAHQGQTHDFVRRWSFEPGAVVHQTPRIAGYLVYLASEDGALTAVDLETGAEVWSVDTGTGFPTDPVIADGVVYVGNQAGPLHALDAASGAPLWVAEGMADAYAPKAAEGMVFITRFGEEGAVLNALNGDTGEVAWTVPLGMSSYGSPSALDGRVFVTGSAGEDQAPAVLGFDIQSGESVWRSAPETPLTLVGAAGDHVLAAGQPGFVALDPGTGEPVWTFQPGSDAPGGVWAADGPAVTDDVLYIGTGIAMGGNSSPSQAGVVYALDVATGEPIWQTEIPGGVAYGPATTVDVVAVAAGLRGGLYILDASSGEVAWYYPNRTGDAAGITAKDDWLIVADADGSISAWQDIA
jgi:outer membrane protein assembly factor BamB